MILAALSVFILGAILALATDNSKIAATTSSVAFVILLLSIE